MSTERIERLAELARRVEQIDAEWGLLDARRRDRSPGLVQLRGLYDWVQDKEQEFRERFPEVAARTSLPPAADPDDLLGDADAARKWTGLVARRSLLEDEWARILGNWEALAVEWQELLDQRRTALETVEEGLARVREQLVARERAISDAIAGVFGQPAQAPRPAAAPSFSSPTDGVAAGAAAVAAEAPAEAGAGLRDAPRVSLGVPINLRVEHRLLQGDTENVSLTGVFVRTPAPLPVGREVDLVFDLPERKGLAAHGRVVWLRPEDVTGGGGVGVRFTVLPDDTRRGLEAFVRRTGRSERYEGTW